MSPDKNTILYISDRPKTDFLVYAENEYSAQGSKHCKNSNLDAEQKMFSGVAAVSCGQLSTFMGTKNIHGMFYFVEKYDLEMKSY
jgi:hypothetical protein